MAYNKLLNFVPATKKRGLHGTAYATLRQPISNALEVTVNIAWKRPWRAVYPPSFNGEAASLQATLEKEVSAKHPLFVASPKVIGRCTASDDVVVSLGDDSLAIVHLTWQGKPDQDPVNFPRWSRVKSVDDLNMLIAEDAAEYDDEDL